MSTTNNTVQLAVERYLNQRRRLGFELSFTGQQLMRFARYADARWHRGPLTLKLQLDWAREHVKRTGPVTWARRLEVVRPFAAYYRQFQPDTEIPDLHTFGPGHRRLAPHIYTRQEVCDLLEQAGRLPPLDGLRPATYRTLFGLIATVGLRLSEALNLRDGDVDLRRACLTVRHTKFNKSRCLPLHSSAVQALNEYRQLRDRRVETRADMPFFVSQSGCALPKRTVQDVFVQLRRQLAWQARGDYPHPRIQDLRHSFAVARLLRWYETGETVDHAVLWLCTYLGHASISDTYWYLSGTPELMRVVGAKFECFALEEVRHA
ncbi:tyrosine-type recombinase/integrase [Cupriavidus sp. BIC8F]|uniref:tyrosine-type recombinase/integrase n=1 Tax=Cupriavidus sp. BIC8F TaxID=3079014 RepID=UPI002915EBFF|nr:tyrosine-type recombinase/integrase [Cupriavidus sp. BIC8F]